MAEDGQTTWDCETDRCRLFNVVVTTERDDNDVRTVQELLGHQDVETPLIYTHVLNRGDRGVHSPLDQPWQAPSAFSAR
jgi:integrase